MAYLQDRCRSHRCLSVQWEQVYSVGTPIEQTGENCACILRSAQKNWRGPFSHLWDPNLYDIYSRFCQYAINVGDRNTPFTKLIIFIANDCLWRVHSCIIDFIHLLSEEQFIYALRFSGNLQALRRWMQRNSQLEGSLKLNTKLYFWHFSAHSGFCLALDCHEEYLLSKRIINYLSVTIW